MTCLTKIELENAQRDISDLAAVINGPQSGTPSQVTTRLGTIIKTLARVLYETSIPTGSAIAGLLDTYLGGTIWRTNREVLSANRIYYVRTDGNNNNSGLTNDAGGAFLTIQKALDVSSELDLSIYSLTIIVSDGTYAGNININKSPIGGSSIKIQGNVTTPANCQINGAFNISVSTQAPLTIEGFRITSTTSPFNFFLTAPLTFYFNNIDFAGSIQGHINASVPGTNVIANGNYSISAAANYSMVAGPGSKISVNNRTITYTTNVTFAVAQYISQYGGVIFIYGMTFVNPLNVTGKRFRIDGVGTVFTNGGGSNYIPGTIAGTGTYLDQSGSIIGYS